MKWMWSMAIIAAVSSAMSAQAAKEMHEPKMDDKMSMAYTGCVETVNHGSWYLLTHVAGDHHDMAHDGMMHAESAMAPADAAHPAPGMPGERAMMSGIALTGRSDLKKHVGQKVRVNGSISDVMPEATPNVRETLTITSLTVVAKSCS